MKRKSKDEVKGELLRSLVEGEEYKNIDLNNRTDNSKSYQDDMPVIQKYETIIQRDKKEIF